MFLSLHEESYDNQWGKTGLIDSYVFCPPPPQTKIQVLKMLQKLWKSKYEYLVVFKERMIPNVEVLIVSSYVLIYQQETF